MDLMGKGLSRPFRAWIYWVSVAQRAAAACFDFAQHRSRPYPGLICEALSGPEGLPSWYDGVRILGVQICRSIGLPHVGASASWRIVRTSLPRRSFGVDGRRSPAVGGTKMGYKNVKLFLREPCT